MADERLRYLVDAVWQGKAQLADARGDISGLDRATDKNKRGLTDWAKAGAAAAAAVAGAAFAAREAYQVISEGADLLLAKEQFDNLAESINTTGDALAGKLRDATGGMVRDSELIASAAELINTGLATTETQAVRLATAVGALGLNMNTLTTTMLNDSEMRLDALQLSAQRVREIQDQLEMSGFVGDSFDEAVIIALEEKMDLLGNTVETTAGKMDVLEARAANVKDRLVELSAVIAGPVVDALYAVATSGEGMADAFDQINRIAKESTSFDDFRRRLDEANLALGDRSAQEYWFNLGQIAREAESADEAMLSFSRTLTRAPIDETAFATRETAEAMKEYGDAVVQAGKAMDEMADSTSAVTDVIDEQGRRLGVWFEEARRAKDEAFDINAELYDMLASGGASAEGLALAGVALGQFSEDAAIAYLKQTLIKQGLAELAAAAVADTTITEQEMADMLVEMERIVEEVNGMEMHVNVDATQAYAEMERVRRELLEIGGTTVTAAINVIGGALGNLPLPGQDGSYTPTPVTPDPGVPSLPPGGPSVQSMSGGGVTVINQFSGPVDRGVVDDLVAKQRQAFSDALSAARSRGSR